MNGFSAKRLTRTALLCVLAVLVMPAASWAALDTAYPYQLTVEPAAGHGGDLFYVSGGRYRPHTKLTFLIGCPDTQPDGTDHMLVGRPGPVTDGHGEFSAFAMHALILPSNMQPPMPCHIYVSDGYHPFGPSAAPVYVVYGNDQPLPSCATRICLKVRQQVARDGSGTYAVAISGWPGMSLRGSVRDRHGTTLGKAIVVSHLRGSRLVWRMARSLACQSAQSGATLHLEASLGTFTGSLDQPFDPPCH